MTPLHTQTIKLNEIMQKRHSTRAFAPQIPEHNKIMSLFEAARWAPSSSNNQPWRYIFATSNETEKHNKIIDCLAEGNKIWAKDAPLLIVSLAKILTNTGKPYRHNLYDAGAANMAIALQATALGMQAHIMGGFDFEKVKNAFLKEEQLDPVVIIAVGYPGDIDLLPENLKLKENLRERLPLESLILE
jgi:nitroreductase